MQCLCFCDVLSGHAKTASLFVQGGDMCFLFLGDIADAEIIAKIFREKACLDTRPAAQFVRCVIMLMIDSCIGGVDFAATALRVAFSP